MRSIIAIALLIFAFRAEAAILADVQGQVTVRSSEGARLVAGASEVGQGTVVSTGADGRVTVYYRNGCHQTIDANQSVVIDEALCAHGEAPGVSQSQFADPGVVIGGIVVMGLTSGFIITSGDKDPASP